MFITANDHGIGGQLQSFTAKTHADKFISLFPTLFVPLAGAAMLERPHGHLPPLQSSRQEG